MNRIFFVAALLIAVSAGGVASMADEGPSSDALAWARKMIEERAERGPEAPAFPADAAWLNVTRPLSMERDLRGRVVLLDFWCYCCVNCMHVLPDLAYLERRYADRPFVVVGVHSAKFENEKDTAAIREAVLRYEIEHPVVNDGNFEIWNAYGARAWPTLVLVGPDGRMLGMLSGEGHREDLDALVQAALEHYEGQGLLTKKADLPLRLERTTRPVGSLAYPGKVAVDGEGKRLFVSDSNHDRILELGLDGGFRRAWGGGETGFVDGDAKTARFFRPQGLAYRDGVLWVADTENHAIRRIDLETGVVTTVAGTGKQGYAREGSFEGRKASLSSPWDLCFVGDDLIVAMAGNHTLWRLDPVTGRIALFAGDGTERRLDAEDLESAAFAQPSGFAWDGTTLYVADSESSSIVAVDPQGGGVRTLAGASESPRDLFHFGDEDGKGRGRRFQHPLDVAFADGVLYVADSYNHKIKKLDPKTGEVRSWLGLGAPGSNDDPAAFSEPGGLAVAGGTLYVADTNNHQVRAIDVATGKVTTLDTTNVPLPQRAAREGGRGDAWPRLPGTVERVLPSQRIAAGQPVRLTLRLDLPEGWKLTDGAPSLAQVELGDSLREANLDGALTTVDLGPVTGTEAALRVRLLYYVCRDEGMCRVQSVDLRVPVEIVEAGEDESGPAEIAITDRFVP